MMTERTYAIEGMDCADCAHARKRGRPVARRAERGGQLCHRQEKLAFIILTLFGVTSLWLAIAADMGVSLLVTFNGMQPLQFDATRREHHA